MEKKEFFYYYGDVNSTPLTQEAFALIKDYLSDEFDPSRVIKILSTRKKIGKFHSRQQVAFWLENKGLR